MKQTLILLGPPGAGKGTQAVILCEKLKIAHISTGDMFRTEISAGSKLGERIKSVLDAGNLVDDTTVMEIINARIQHADCKDGFLLDGCVRTVGQAEAFDKLLKKNSLPLSRVIEIDVPEAHILDRITTRGKNSGRSDDSLEVLSNRLQVYWQQTAPLIDYYEKQKKLVRVDGVGTVEEVSQRILEKLQ